MNNQDLIELGLNGKGELKVILKASIEKVERDLGITHKAGVVSVIFATLNRELAKQKMIELSSGNDDNSNFYMVYSIPFDTELTTLEHFPSIAVFKEDLCD